MQFSHRVMAEMTTYIFNQHSQLKSWMDWKPKYECLTSPGKKTTTTEADLKGWVVAEEIQHISRERRILCSAIVLLMVESATGLVGTPWKMALVWHSEVAKEEQAIPMSSDGSGDGSLKGEDVLVGVASGAEDTNFVLDRSAGDGGFV